MQIEFERTGGFAGLRLATSVDTTELPADEAAGLRQALDDARFYDLPPHVASPSAGPDRFQYRLTVRDGERVHTVLIDESAVPTALRSLIDRLSAAARQRPARSPPADTGPPEAAQSPVSGKPPGLWARLLRLLRRRR